MMSETIIDQKIKDTYGTHLFHEHYEKDCSECYKKKRAVVDGILLLAKQQKQ